MAVPSFGCALELDTELGWCGETLVSRPKQGGVRAYQCVKGPGFSGCGRISVKANPLEQFVVEAVLYRLRIEAGGVEAVEAWASLPLTRQHAIVAAILDHITVAPPGVQVPPTQKGFQCPPSSLVLAPKLVVRLPPPPASPGLRPAWGPGVAPQARDGAGRKPQGGGGSADVGPGRSIP